MKKLMTMAAVIMAAAISQAASVGWSVATGSTTYANASYYFFVLGQNGVENIATVTGLLETGGDVSSYAFGSGTLAANGSHTATATTTGKSLAAGSYESFVVLFDSATPTSGDSLYVVISGQPNQTKEVSATTANVVFATGSAASIVNTASNWKSYGSNVPEPTSGMLALLGMAGLALRRKRV